MSIFDSARNILKDLQNKATSIASSFNQPTLQSPVPHPMMQQQPQQQFQFNPGQMLLQGAGAVQQRMQNLQHASIPDITRGILSATPLNPGGQGLQWGYQALQNAAKQNVPVLSGVAGMGQSVVESPANYAQGIVREGQALSQGAPVNQQLANVGQIAQLPLNVMGGGIGKDVAKEAAEKSLTNPSTWKALWQAVVDNAGTGAKVGGAFGATQGLQSGRDINNVGDYAKNLAVNTGTGAIAGAVTGGVTGGAGYLGGAFMKAFPKAEPSIQQQAEQLLNRDVQSGRFIPKGQSQLETVQDWVRKQTGKPAGSFVSASDLKQAVGKSLKDQGGFIDFGAKVGGKDVQAGIGEVKNPVSSASQDVLKGEPNPITGEQPQLGQQTSTNPQTIPLPDNSSGGSIPQSTQDYIKQMQQQQNQARSVEKGGLLQKGQSFIADVKRKLVDSTAPIEDILSSAQKKGKFQVLPTKDISPQIDRSIRSRELAGQFLKDNGMVDVIRGVPDVNALDQYLIAKHAPEVATTTGRNPQADAQLVKDLAPTYEPYAQKVVQYGQRVLDYATQSGLVSKKTAMMLKQKYPNYVPLNRIFNALEQVKPPEGVGVRGPASISGQSVVQKLKGSERAIQNPIESLLTKTTDAFAQGERNQAGQMLASYKDLPGNPFQLKELKPGESALHTISYLDNGVKKIFETTPEVAQAAKFLDKRQLGFIGNLFATPVRLARVGITGVNVPFIASNVVKDQVSATINSERPLATSIANPAVFVKSLWNAVGHGAEYDNWIRSAGGGTSFDISRSAPETSVAQIRAGANIGSKIKYTATHPQELLRAVENIVNRGEELTRLQQFTGTKEALLKQGRTAADANILAAKASRDNTVNFGRSGDWGKALNSVFLYMNAGIQGSRTLVRSLQQRPIQTAAKIGLTVFTPLAAVTAWNMSDPKRLQAYNDIRDFEKENNMVIIPPNPTKDASGKWNVIKIPFSQEIANLTIPVRKSIEAMHGASPPTFMDVAGALLGSSTSLNTQTPNALIGQFIPQAIKPPLEATLNKNLFTGTDIVPQYLPAGASKDLPPDQQVYPDTSGTARAIGKVVNTSPLKVEQFIKSTAGGVGSQALNASDTVLNKLGLIPNEQVGGQSIPAGISQRFSQATGGQQLTNLFNKNTPRNTDTSIVENNGKFYVNLGNGNVRGYPTRKEAEGSTSVIMSQFNTVKTPEQKAALWQQMVKDGRINKNNISDIRQEALDKQLGLTEAERKIRGQGVASGERATSIIAEFKKVTEPTAKVALWQKYLKAKIITPEVYKSIQAQLKK